MINWMKNYRRLGLSIVFIQIFLFFGVANAETVFDNRNAWDFAKQYYFNDNEFIVLNGSQKIEELDPETKSYLITFSKLVLVNKPIDEVISALTPTSKNPYLAPLISVTHLKTNADSTRSEYVGVSEINIPFYTLKLTCEAKTEVEKRQDNATLINTGSNCVGPDQRIWNSQIVQHFEIFSLDGTMTVVVMNSSSQGYRNNIGILRAPLALVLQLHQNVDHQSFLSVSQRLNITNFREIQP